MSLASQISAVVSRIATECKAIRAAIPAPRQDMFVFVGGKPDAGERVSTIVAPVAFSIPAGLTDSRARAETGATASSAFSLRKNGVQFGTITFGAGATAGTLAAATSTAFAIGDRLEVFASASQDATLADVSLTIVGTR